MLSHQEATSLQLVRVMIVHGVDTFSLPDCNALTQDVHRSMSLINVVLHLQLMGRLWKVVPLLRYEMGAFNDNKIINYIYI